MIPSKITRAGRRLAGLDGQASISRQERGAGARKTVLAVDDDLAGRTSPPGGGGSRRQPRSGSASRRRARATGAGETCSADAERIDGEAQRDRRETCAGHPAGGAGETDCSLPAGTARAGSGSLRCWGGAALSRPPQRAGRGAGEPRRRTLEAANAAGSGRRVAPRQPRPRRRSRRRALPGATSAASREPRRGALKRRMPLKATRELRRGSCASGGEADGAHCLAQRPGRPHACAIAQQLRIDAERGGEGWDGGLWQDRRQVDEWTSAASRALPAHLRVKIACVPPLLHNVRMLLREVWRWLRRGP